MSVENSETADRYWARTRSLTILVLVLWAIFSLLIPWFAGALNSISFLGFPLGFYMIAQGSLIVFVILVFFQNWRQDSIDDEFGYAEEK